MKRITPCLWLAAPAIFGLMAYQGRIYVSRSAPRVEVPDVIDFGRQRPGEYALAALTVRNLGRQPLELTDIKPCCGTSVTLWRDRGATDRQLTRAMVPPGGELAL